MSLRREFLISTIAELERVVTELAKYPSITPDQMRADLSLRWTVERGLLAGLTLVFQIADHILASHFGRSPETYEGLLVGLRGAGVISEGSYRQFQGAGGFRNVLVHEYVAVDLNEVTRAVRSAPEIFRAFAREVLQWIDALPQGE